MHKFSDDFKKGNFTAGPYPPPHSIEGDKVPPDGDRQPTEHPVFLRAENGPMPIGLSYPAGQDFGPYVQHIGEGWNPQQMGADLSNAIPFSCGNIHPHTALMLYALVLNQRPQVIVETGTFYGYSAWVMACALATWGDEGAMVYTIDPEQALIADQVKDHPYIDCRAGLSQNVLPELLEEVGEVQFAFLDSSKRIAYREFQTIDPYMPEGGIICFHDTQMLNTGYALYACIMERHPEYDNILFSGTPHKTNPHRYFGNADDRGFFVLRKREHDPFLLVWDAESHRQKAGDRHRLFSLPFPAPGEL